MPSGMDHLPGMRRDRRIPAHTFRRADSLMLIAADQQQLPPPMELPQPQPLPLPLPQQQHRMMIRMMIQQQLPPPKKPSQFHSMRGA